MSFRRPGKATLEQARDWERWRRTHHEALAVTGLPESVLRDEEHWWDFLHHGFLDHHDDPSHFTVAQLSLEQRRALRRFLQKTLSPDERSSAIVLRRLENAAS
jgi:hypothetical protein